MKCCVDEQKTTTKTPLPARLSSVGVQKLADTIWAADNILTERECQAIIDASKDSLYRSTVLKGESEEDLNINDGRTSSNAWLLAKDLDTESEAFKVLHKIERVSESFTDIPIVNQEGLQVLKYNEGEQYESHHDFFHANHKEYDKVMAEGGQRIWTVYFYLNDVEEGGETFFPRLDVKVKPKMGSAAIWLNVIDGEVFHPSLHWGMPPIKGVKWGCTKWCREREFSGVQHADQTIRNEIGKEMSNATSRYPTIDINPAPGDRHEEERREPERTFTIKKQQPIDSSNAEVIIV
jgi:prolyl 4-hydroxylase